MVPGPIDPRLGGGVLQHSARPELQGVVKAPREDIDVMWGTNHGAYVSRSQVTALVGGAAPLAAIVLPASQAPVPRDAEHIKAIRRMRDRADRTDSQVPAQILGAGELGSIRPPVLEGIAIGVLS